MTRFHLIAILLILLTMPANPAQSQDRKATNASKPEEAMMPGHGHHHDEMAAHMKMTVLRPKRAGDEDRAAATVKAARQVLERYQDYKTALADGFQIFLPNVPQPMYHFTNYRYALEAELRFNADRPTSLLYEKQGNGYKLIGAMYTASASLAEAELDRRIPLSIAQWHEHVNICFPPDGRRAEALKANPQFGLRGSIANRSDCEKAGGTFRPLLFGWMVHVYPFEDSTEKIWSLERQMQNAAAIDSDFNIGKPQTPASDGKVKQATGSYKSEAKEISYELFEPDGTGKYPAIVMLYGSGGMDVGGALFREVAKLLAQKGYVVYLPHYLEKTGTERASMENYVKYFAPWMRAVEDMIGFAKNQTNVDVKRIGLIGFSLGAYLSLSIASVDNQVKTVVEYFGGLPDFFSKQVQTMPPVLILHGDADKAVPVAEARKLEALLKEKKSPYEIKIYEGQGHGFTGLAAVDALQRTLGFFEKQLKGGQ